MKTSPTKTDFATWKSLRKRAIAATLLSFMSMTGSVWAQVPPTVVVTPTSIAATNTSVNVSFTAMVTGDPSTLEWHYIDTNNNDFTLPETNAVLTIPIVSPTDAGSYYVIASNDAGSTNSTTNTLTVTTPASQPVIQTVYSQDYGFDPLNTTADLFLGLKDPNVPVLALTDGSDNNGVASGSGFYALGAGSVQTFDLYAPCNISEIDTYSACTSSAGYNGVQVDQNYVVSVSTNNGVSYTNLYPVKARMSLLYEDAAPADMQVQLTPNNAAPLLASNVDHIRFTFNNDAENANLNVDYVEFIAYGTNTMTPGKPVITQNVPASVEGTYLLSYSISVSVLANPVPTFQWYLLSGGATNAIPNATNSTYTVNQAQLTNNLSQYQVVVSNSYGSVTSAVATVTLLGVVQVTNTVYQDAFGRIGALNGTTPSPTDASTNTWLAYSQLNTDGSEVALTNNSPIGGLYPNGFLPFVPQVGHIYTLSANIKPLTGGSQWVALGYALNAITTNYYAGATCGVGWLLERGNDTQAQLFKGPGTGNKLINLTGPGDTNDFKTFSIVLNTTTGSASTGWTITYFTNGTQVTQSTFSPNPAIQYVGLGADAATGYFQNFLLTDVGYVTIQPLLSVVGTLPGPLSITWPSAYIGWTLQSNSFGLTSSNEWFAVPGSTATNQVPLPIDSTKTNVFFRLLAP